ncbi:MAG: hypothetical protein ACE361_16960 [Aureliella sp.]
MPIRAIHIDWDDSILLPPAIDEWISMAGESIQAFWDSRKEKMLKGWVECDYRLVAQALLQLSPSHASSHACVVSGPFLEWGSGFAVVAGIAAKMGMEATGIESEAFLHRAALRLHQRESLDTELIHGNFLPNAAKELAEASDPVVSLAVSANEAYSQLGRSLSEYRTVFVYAWPGEEHFLKAVFERYAGANTILLLYRGPYHLEIYRKTLARTGSENL